MRPFRPFPMDCLLLRNTLCSCHKYFTSYKSYPLKMWHVPFSCNAFRPNIWHEANQDIWEVVWNRDSTVLITHYYTCTQCPDDEGTQMPKQSVIRKIESEFHYKKKRRWIIIVGNYFTFLDITLPFPITHLNLPILLRWENISPPGTNSITIYR